METSTIQLRPHQIKAMAMLRRALSTNALNSNKRAKRILIAGCCAFGKTVLAAYIAQQAVTKGNKVMFLADRIKLINQTADKFESFGIDFGVQRGNDQRAAPWKPVQIASIQTMKTSSRKPEANIFIVDECHISHAYVVALMSEYNNCIFIGLTATPYSRGLANIWQDMLVPATTRELLDAGYLTPIDYYVGHKVDMTNVRKSNGEYNQGDLAKSVDKDEVLTGDIIKNWMSHAKGRPMQTIAFTPSIDHSKGLVELFMENGVKAEHIDCYTSEDERDALYEAHDRGEFCILSCSQLRHTAEGWLTSGRIC